MLGRTLQAGLLIVITLALGACNQVEEQVNAGIELTGLPAGCSELIAPSRELVDITVDLQREAWGRTPQMVDLGRALADMDVAKVEAIMAEVTADARPVDTQRAADLLRDYQEGVQACAAQ